MGRGGGGMEGRSGSVDGGGGRRGAASARQGASTDDGGPRARRRTASAPAEGLAVGRVWVDAVL